MPTALVLGATGYVGGRLVPRLIARGMLVRCLVRDVNKIRGKRWASQVECFKGDVLEPQTLEAAFHDVDVVYYLVHSMGSGGEFEQLDRRAAANVAAAAERAGAKRLIYLGGLGKRSPDQSAHLRSRHMVGEVLREGSVPVTEFRAAVIVGSGSASFEIIHHLVNRLPLMICPRWVFTRTQPIGISDVLQYLIQALDRPRTTGRRIDIGGPQVLTYGEMIKTTAEVLGLRRFLIPVPVLTPRLSSYWVNLVTPIQAQIARPLIDGLRFETVCENDDALHLFDIQPLSFREAVQRAVANIRSHRIETYWTDATAIEPSPPIEPSHLRTDRRELAIDASAETVFGVIKAIGGANGWYYGNWLWRIRGFLDQQLGGVGLRRGRRHPTEIAVGDALDFWRVEEYVEGEKLLLRAEMIVWGQAWLEFHITGQSLDGCLLEQTARYYPRGLFGLLYWYTVYPLHVLVFRGLIRAIESKSLQQPRPASGCTPASG